MMIIVISKNIMMIVILLLLLLLAVWVIIHHSLHVGKDKDSPNHGQEYHHQKGNCQYNLYTSNSVPWFLCHGRSLHHWHSCYWAWRLLWLLGLCYIHLGIWNKSRIDRGRTFFVIVVVVHMVRDKCVAIVIVLFTTSNTQNTVGTWILTFASSWTLCIVCQIARRFFVLIGCPLVVVLPIVFILFFLQHLTRWTVLVILFGLIIVMSIHTTQSTCGIPCIDIVIGAFFTIPFFVMRVIAEHTGHGSCGKEEAITFPG
mmetsp:Transcript_19006/g.44272  ORF Transcript_19006/g.44272 Transcript_19006/m.44272 type:complete len:257 (+) Transcript_19006:594-1364(+)